MERPPQTATHSPWRFCVAPMLDWTDRHCRYFLRLLSRRARLYSEMITASALLRGATRRWLAHHPAEHPLALQLGGGEAAALACAARLAADAGFDEINLNVGCPSDRVHAGRFGACLMAEPERVAESVAAMRAAVRVPVTVKTRLGIDHHDSYEFLHRFVSTVAEAGCTTFIIHARKAWLRGLSPRENRSVPPLDYARVYRLKQDFPQLTIVINGGITTLEQSAAHLPRVDGVMLGRAVYHDPYLLAAVDRSLFGDPTPAPSRHEVVARLQPYVATQLARGTPLQAISRHLLGLFQGQPGARAWRRHLSEQAHRQGADGRVLLDAARQVRRRG
ncbi:MAG TPA: tRNA dihydrouridine(20/20a) synthase DusA [Gammaproteobacteria bacterium]|nr:tRNA dihydrouridine(20/20a) synthase DusA [Gammaproteobacteria bacterium]